jgi:alanyl-tRNA synthetase
MTPNEIRESYLRFFEERAHTRVSSASLVPENDPSLLFTGAGMNQFKDEFLGKGKRGLTRATSSQKCLRTGDLENVGRTPGHQSFFEMLGNFSFGDYFKKEAIAWAWEYLTEVLQLPAEKLSATVYLDDDEAYAIWRDDIGLPEERLYRMDAKSNFWPANAPEDGPNGPCGPCSEIFFDYGEQPHCPDKAACDPECDCKRYEEIWNLVFTQFDRRDGGVLEPLPQKNIDTGMGFERLIRVLEQVPTNTETSLFQPILAAIASVSGREGYTREGEDGVRMRRIADHIRAGCFLVGDGVRPGNEGRGYVLRRILRRAIRDGAGLGIEDAFLARLVGSVVEAMGEAYPDLQIGRELLEGVLNAEEQLFRKTFRNGMKRLEGEIGSLREFGGAEMSADVVFQLHDTFGFPVDVTAEILQEQDITFDRARFDELMEEQRERSRSAQKMSDEIFERGPVGELAENGVQPTEFLGYDDPSRGTAEEQRGVVAQATLAGIILEKDQKVHREVRDGERAMLVLDCSPFYSESGGQISDAGEIRFETGVFRVEDVRASEGYTLHVGTYSGEAPAQSGSTCEARVDETRRDAIRRNHTATHILHRALKDRLGDQVQQAGSLVAPDKLRFDFTLDRGLTPEDIQVLEDAVNAEVLANARLDTQLMSVEDAKQSGAVALFGEKYPEPVRVVAVGEYSRELCGGTHCRAAGDIGSFRIVSESSIAAGIRRVEAITGQDAVRSMQEDRAVLQAIGKKLGVPPTEIETRIEKMAKDIRELRKRASSAMPALDPFSGEPVEAGALKLHVHLLDQPRDAIANAAKPIPGKDGDPVGALLVSQHDGKVAAICALNKAAVDVGFDAVAILKGVGGRGGGRPQTAQGTIPGELTLDGLRAAAASALGG